MSEEQGGLKFRMSNGTVRALVICNGYPSKRALYKNGFIHSRVVQYRNAGLAVDVYYHHEPVISGYRYQYEGVDVYVGRSADLKRHIAELSYDVFLVHFASPERVLPLIEMSPQTPIICWIHGFEAEAWHRRWFNFIDSSKSIQEALDKKIEFYDSQTRFMKWFIENRSLKTTFVNVSHWFQNFVVEPDLRVSFDNSVVIPNPIDDRLFLARKKNPEFRKRILSIRPFASEKYANDLSVECILELSKRPFFKELKFEIVGQGRLFKETLAPLDGFPNVEITEGFLKPTEIVAAHARNGVFLCPTRFDSQGVSMCEAMSSGLVPVATNIAAIPEFAVNDSSALLVPPESPLALADAIEELYFDAELYSSLSTKAASSIREICGATAVSEAELDLILDRACNT